jgi:hypothetical protein
MFRYGLTMITKIPVPVWWMNIPQVRGTLLIRTVFQSRILTDLNLFCEFKIPPKNQFKL